MYISVDTQLKFFLIFTQNHLESNNYIIILAQDSDKKKSKYLQYLHIYFHNTGDPVKPK